MHQLEFQRRTKRFALRVIDFVSAMPRNKVTDLIGFQLLKSGTSIDANYRKANWEKLHSDFIHKIDLAAEEAAQTQHWLELCQEAALGLATERRWLLSEARELAAIFTQIGNAAKTLI
jgi:four helix bundle protein